MDLLEKNMILKTTDLLLNYGEIDATQHILVGNIQSSSPFTLTVLGDQDILVPLQDSILTEDKHILIVSSQFTTGLVSKFELKLEGSEFDINVKLWKPYPITKPLRAEAIEPRGVPPPQNGLVEDFLNPSETVIV